MSIGHRQNCVEYLFLCDSWEVKVNSNVTLTLDITNTPTPNPYLPEWPSWPHSSSRRTLAPWRQRSSPGRAWGWWWSRSAAASQLSWCRPPRPQSLPISGNERETEGKVWEMKWWKIQPEWEKRQTRTTWKESQPIEEKWWVSQEQTIVSSTRCTTCHSKQTLL